MADVRERTVEVKRYTLDLDEQEYELLKRAVSLVGSIAKNECTAKDAFYAASQMSRAWEIVKQAQDGMPDWWPEDQRYHLPENELTAEQIRELAQGNHIWVNAFSAIVPSDEVLIELGRSVMSMLNSSHLRTEGFGKPDEKGHRAGESPVVYIRVNKS